MIDLTPLEVRKKKGDFRRTMRGYEPQAVDDFLDLVADRLEQIVREHFALNERVSAIDSQIADYRERERALTEALVSAQEMREDMRRQMEREADLKRREAEAEVDAMRSTAVQQLEREEDNIRRLRARQGQFVQGYRAFLERELAELAVIAETLDAHNILDEDAPSPKKRAKRTEVDAATSMPTPVPVPVPLPMAEPEPREPEPFVPEPLEPEPEPVLAAAIEPESQPEPQPESHPEPQPALKSEPQPEVALAVDDVETELPASFDTDFDALLDEVPFAPLEAEPPLPLARADLHMDLGAEPPDADVVDIDLIDEKDEDDGESDGWVSTLLEGKGD